MIAAQLFLIPRRMSHNFFRWDRFRIPSKFLQSGWCVYGSAVAVFPLGYNDVASSV